MTNKERLNKLQKKLRATIDYYGIEACADIAERILVNRNNRKSVEQSLSYYADGHPSKPGTAVLGAIEAVLEGLPLPRIEGRRGRRRQASASVTSIDTMLPQASLEVLKAVALALYDVEPGSNITSRQRSIIMGKFGFVDVHNLNVNQIAERIQQTIVSEITKLAEQLRETA